MAEVKELKTLPKRVLVNQSLLALNESGEIEAVPSTPTLGRILKENISDEWVRLGTWHQMESPRWLTISHQYRTGVPSPRIIRATANEITLIDGRTNGPITKYRIVKSGVNFSVDFFFSKGSSGYTTGEVYVADLFVNGLGTRLSKAPEIASGDEVKEFNISTMPSFFAKIVGGG